MDEALTKLQTDTASATQPSHALRFPLYTALRPVVVLANPCASPPPSTIRHTSAHTARNSFSTSYSGLAVSSISGGASGAGPAGAGDKGACSFGEALFVRGLVSTLLANAAVLEPGPPGEGEAAHGQGLRGAEAGDDLGGVSVGGASASGQGLNGFGAVMGPGCKATDLVWWDATQPQIAVADVGLSRCVRVRDNRACAR